MYIKSKIGSKNHKHNTDVSELPMIPQSNDDDIKCIEGKSHTLFIKDADPEMKEFTAVDDGKEFSAVREIYPKHKEFTLYLGEFSHEENELHKILYNLRSAEAHDKLHIRIDSPGGSVSEGITLYNTMRELFNGRTTTFLDSTGFSMGAMLFALGDIRTSYEGSSLMFHTYSTFSYGKSQELKSYIDFEDKHFENFFVKKIVSKGFLTPEEYERMKIGQDFWFDSYEMAKRGICTHVIVSGYTLDSEAFIAYHDQDKHIDEWVIDTLTKMLEEENKEDEEVVEKPKKKKIKKLKKKD
jgi:ATP-dependent protease ClpP protease subunit